MPSENYVFSILDKVVEASDHPKHQLAAAIVYRNRIVSLGYNRMKSDPLQARFGENSEKIYLHAEIAAIKNALKCLGVFDLKRCSLYIYRKKKVNGVYCMGLAKPCSGCMRAIVEFGLKEVIYSNDKGNVDRIKV
jgi:deoxycytidylate deaminase